MVVLLVPLLICSSSDLICDSYEYNQFVANDGREGIDNVGSPLLCGIPKPK